MIILIFILVGVTYVFVAVFSSSFLDKKSMDSHLLEAIWTVVPMVILLFMAFPSLYLLYLMEETLSPTLTVKVIGHQWYWEYQYSNSWLSQEFDSYMLHDKSGLAIYHNLDVDNRLVLPSFSRILFLVTSVDVLHSWTVPVLGIKVDAVPGRLNYLASKATSSGVFYGQCSEVCGSNHRFMPIVLEFISPAHFVRYMSSL